jgi:hypothetical protein
MIKNWYFETSNIRSIFALVLEIDETNYKKFKYTT